MIGLGQGALNARKTTCIRGHAFTGTRKCGKERVCATCEEIRHRRVCAHCKKDDRKRRYWENRDAAIKASHDYYHANKTLKGVRNIDHLAKLTMEKANDIRRRAEGGEKLSAIAEEYGVTYQNVWAIVRGKTWNSKTFVPSPPLEVERVVTERVE